MSSFCSYYNEKTCRSCGHIEVDYSSQLKRKEERLIEALKIKGLLSSVASKEQGFRNKAKMVVTGTFEQPIIGILAGETLNCPVHHPEINKILSFLPDFIRLAKLVPYEIASRKGELKGLIIYFSEGSGESYLRFVTRSKESLTRIKKHLPWLQENIPALASVSVNIQPIPHAILEGDEEIFITDKTSIKHMLGEVEMNLNPKGFVQTNQEMAKKLYATAALWTKELKIKKFAELFCGQGAFSFFIAPHVQECIGFEINPDAVVSANETAQRLNKNNMSFKCADATKVDTEVRNFAPDLLLVNPPRRGLGEGISFLRETPAQFVIYSSCSLDSLAKDLTELSSSYEVCRVQLFDMFPHTEHFETLVLLKARA